MGWPRVKKDKRPRIVICRLLSDSVVELVVLRGNLEIRGWPLPFADLGKQGSTDMDKGICKVLLVLARADWPASQQGRSCRGPQARATVVSSQHGTWNVQGLGQRECRRH